MSIRSLVAASSIVLAASSTHAAVLYDGSVDASPTAHGLTYVAIPAAAVTTSGGGTTLDTTATNGTYAGYGTNAIPLDRNAGFTLRVDARLLAESHANTARAGFSLLVVSSDLKAIEIGFHLDEVFSQAAVTSLSRGEVAPLDTTSAAHRYDLVVLGNNYALKTDSVTTLTGLLRDYTDFAGPINPYVVPNSVFLGDDTTSA